MIDPRPYPRRARPGAGADVPKPAPRWPTPAPNCAARASCSSARRSAREEFETEASPTCAPRRPISPPRGPTSHAQRSISSFTTVRSPITGRVSDKRVSTRRFCRPTGQTLLTRVVSVDPIWFSFEGAESFYLKYLRQDRKRRAPLVALRAQSGRDPARRRKRTIAGTAAWRSSTMRSTRNSGTIRAHAVVANPDGFLTPGMFGRARLLGSGTYQRDAGPRRGDRHRSDAPARLCRRATTARSPRAPSRPGRWSRACASSRRASAATDRVVIDGLATPAARRARSTPSMVDDQAARGRHRARLARR